MAKRIIFGEELRDQCSKTMSLINRAVSSSLGPSGKLTLMELNKVGAKISKDGVSIARHLLPLEDPVMNLIGSKIIEVAQKTNADAGDGTTGSIVLANAIFKEAIKHIKEKRIDAVIVKDAIEETLLVINKALDKVSRKIETLEDMENVATISANNDREIGKLIAKAIDKVGQFGFVTLVEGDGEKAELKITEGMQINKGASTERYMKGQVSMEFEEPRIFIFDGKIDAMETLHDLYSQIPNQPFVVIAELGEAAQEYLIQNVRQGTMTAVHIPPPMFKGLRTRILQDIAIAVGAELVDPYKYDMGKSLPKEVLGQAKRIVFNKYNTNIIEGGNGSKDYKTKVLQRIEELEEEMEATRSDYEKDMVRERISRLTATAAVIGVGGRTEDEILERKDRFEDALNATRSAILEGVIPGGGYTLFKIAQKLKGETLGEKIFKIAMEAPLRQIIANTGVDVEDVVNDIRLSNKGYDARNHKLVNMMKKGIIDPVKSTKSGLKNAVSIVDLLINLEVLSVTVLDKDNIKDTLSALRDVNANDV